MSVRIGALLLAAGASTRLGTPKQLLPRVQPDGSRIPLVSSVVHDLEVAGCDPVVVVIGAHADVVTHALIHDAATVFLVPNRDWAEGMGGSIRTGIAAMSVHPAMGDVDAVLIVACDMPTADVAHFVELTMAACAADPMQRVASAYGDTASPVRGIPAVFPRRDWPALLALAGDRGAKALLEADDTVTVRLEGGTFDLDTPDDVAAWHAMLGVDGSSPSS